MYDRPILYSFRRCPYAIRARLAIANAGVDVELREVKLREKPQAMLDASPKGTVPVLVLKTGEVIDESLDIMHWALGKNDPEGWMQATASDWSLIDANDAGFKHWLDRYKYADRYPERTQAYYRQKAVGFLEPLEQRLTSSAFLAGAQASIVDVALLPFVRQFAGVEPGWLAASRFTRLQHWLDFWLTHPLFTQVMTKYTVWQAGTEGVLFPDCDENSSREHSA